ncbi:hypothetical protein MTO96_021560 [Rhipicephalus appendiculatus]
MADEAGDAPNSDSDFEDMEDGDVEDDDDMSDGGNVGAAGAGAAERRVYVPGTTTSNEDGEELECDQSAYVVYHQATTIAPCLSFDIIKDSLGDDRADRFPLTCYLTSGTQA